MTPSHLCEIRPGAGIRGVPAEARRPEAAGAPGHAPRSRGRRGRRARPAPPDWPTLDRVGGLLKVAPDSLARARDILTLLGDPGRRTILERLSRQPQRPGLALAGLTGMNGADIYHRLRSLRWARVLVKDRHFVYHVDPLSLDCARQYIDTLIVASSTTARSPSNDH